MIGLNHPNIVKAYEYFDNPTKGEVHLIMQYVDGMEVLDHLASMPHSCYTEDMARQVFRQMMKGICYLHENGICHRDIKPQNLFVTKADQRVFILDFNVCKKKKDDGWHMRTKTGTAQFSAPEIFSTVLNEYDEKVDIWSAGIVLHMMLCGVVPF